MRPASQVAAPSAGCVNRLSASPRAKPVKFTTSGRILSRKSVNTSTIISAEKTAHFSASGVGPNAR